ncbi:uncharacterized protein ACDP82_019158 isoform 3-T3 [Pangshura tecta]
MDRSTFPKPGGARPDVSQCKKLGNRTRVSKETCRGESDAPQDELKNLDGTKTEQLVKSVKDKLRSEMNGRLQGMVKHLQILEESIRGESEAPQDKLTNLGGTKMEQFVKSVEDKLRSEMNALYEGMVTQLQFLEESLRRESEALQGKLRNLDGTEMEQLVKSVEDKLTSEMNDQFECMRNYLQFLKEILRGESDGPQDKLTNLDGTKMEQLVNSVEDKLISEMNGRFQHMLKHLQFLKERFRGESKAPEDKLTYLDGTKMEQLVKCVEDKLTSEMNERFECIRNHLQCLKEILSTKLLGRRWWCCCHFYAGKASNELTLIPNTSVPYRGESDGPQDKLTNLDGTKMEQLVNSVEDTLTSEMNGRFQRMLKHLQFLKERFRGESEAPEGKLIYLDGTKMEQLVKFVEDNLRSEMNALYEGMVTQLQFLEESLRGESEAPEGKLTYLDGTKMEQLVKSVEDSLRSEINALYEVMGKHLQFLEKSLRGKSEAPQGKLTNLDGTKIESLVNSVEDNLRSEMNALYEDMVTHLQFLEERLSQEAGSRIDSCCSRSQKATSKSQCFAQKELPRMVSAEEFHQKEEECEKLKEQKKVLEQKLDLVLANAMGSHKFSENLNDPCRLSAVLEMYDGLRIHEWEKTKCAASFSAFPMTYEKGSTIIKAVFSICEKDLSQRLEQIFELLEIPVSKKTTSLFDSQQLLPGLAGEIKNHLKNLYFNYGEDFYQAKSRPALAPDQQRFQPLVKFTAKCYKIYCLLLLQDPPIKVMWPTNGRITTAYIEHVDNKVIESSIPIKFLWPLLTCGNHLLRKGVIYD